jgi:hypothetical protein
MEYDGAPGASAKKPVAAKKNLSKFIKPYSRTDKPTNGIGAIVAGSSGGVRAQHLVTTNPDETDTDTDLRIKSSMVVQNDSSLTPSGNMSAKKRVIQTAQSR